MTEEDIEGGSLQLESKQALLPRANRIREAVCGWNGLLAWAVCTTFLLLVFGITLVWLDEHFECTLPLGKGSVASHCSRASWRLAARVQPTAYTPWVEAELLMVHFLSRVCFLQLAEQSSRNTL